MNKRTPSLLVAAALGAGVLIGNAIAQRGPKLDAQDYVDIRQLIDGYSRVLENCTNNGNDYANLYTPDGTFGVSQTWGGGAKVWFRGREPIVRFFAARVTAPGQVRIVQTRANGQPALATYLRAASGGYAPNSVHLISSASGEITTIVAFVHPAFLDPFLSLELRD